jgi:hypothetical protein
MQRRIDGWIKDCADCLDLTGPVWGTVTGRERLWYSFFFGANEMQQPDLTDVRQPIGAGAKRGLLWKLRKEGLITDAQTISGEQLEEILERLCSKRQAFESAFENAIRWLHAEVKKAAGSKLETRAAAMIADLMQEAAGICVPLTELAKALCEMDSQGASRWVRQGEQLSHKKQPKHKGRPPKDETDGLLPVAAESAESPNRGAATAMGAGGVEGITKGTIRRLARRG